MPLKKTFQLLLIIGCSWKVGLLTAQNTKDMKDIDSKTTLVVTSTANQEHIPALRVYVKKVMPMLVGLNGIVIKRSEIMDVFKGEKEFHYLLIMDFPSKMALQKMFNSDAYKALIPERDKGFISMNILFANDVK